MANDDRNSSSAYWLDELARCPVCTVEGPFDFITPGCSQCDWTGFVQFKTTEDYLGMAADRAEAERMAAWSKFDICAAAWQAHGAEINKTMASLLNVTTRSIRTWVSLGLTFPPDNRSYIHEPQLFINALKADDPIATVEYAIDQGYSPKELKDWLASGKDDQAVTEVRELIHLDKCLEGDEVTFFTLLRMFKHIRDAFPNESAQRATVRSATKLTLRVNLLGTFPKETQETA